MKFAHLADAHIGSWRDPKLKKVNTDAFIKAIDICLEQEVDFVIIAGDLFNTSMPGIDAIKTAVIKLKELKENNIPVYMIAGSHDFSPSGKTMLDVIEHAGLMKNVAKGEVEDGRLRLNFTVDPKTGAKITGILGKRAMLEKSYYEALDRPALEKEDGYKIFIFHTALTELKPEGMERMDSAPLSLLPKGFDYYAGGHVHTVYEGRQEGYGTITYPGPVFPNSFSELEKLKRGGMYIVEDGKATWHAIEVYKTLSLDIDGSHKTAEELQQRLLQQIDLVDFKDSIVTLRVSGTLSSGKPSDIDFNDIFKRIYDKGAYFIMKNISKLRSKEFEEIKTDRSSIEEIEESVISEHLGQISIGRPPEEERQLTQRMMSVLMSEKQEGETTSDFESRLSEDVDSILN